MMITIKSRGFSLTQGLKEFIEDRMRLIFTRYGQHVSRIDITLLDINGPKGGEDKRCKIRLKLDGMPSIIIQETDTDMYEAINNCGSRLKRTVSRKLDKVKQYSKFAY